MIKDGFSFKSKRVSRSFFQRTKCSKEKNNGAARHNINFKQDLRQTLLNFMFVNVYIATQIQDVSYPISIWPQF